MRVPAGVSASRSADEVSQPTLDPIADHRSTNCLGDDETDSHLITRGAVRVQHKGGTGQPVRPCRMVRRKSSEWLIRTVLGNTASASQSAWSAGELLAALAAPGGQDRATRSGTHPQAKTMGTAATPVARLERALAHGKAPQSR